MVKALLFIHQPDRVARKASVVSAVYVMMAFIFWCESNAEKSSHPVTKNYEQRDSFFYGLLQ